MSYDPQWTNGNAQGLLEGCVHRVRAADAQELADALSRRLLLVYQGADNFADQIAADQYVLAQTLGRGDLTRSIRDYVRRTVIEPEPYGLGGIPPSPQSMQWLWPVEGPDENKVIVVGQPEEGQVCLFEKLNGTADWTNATPSQGLATIRAVHFNELRQAMAWLYRGRWTLPLYGTTGLFSMVPDTPWYGGAVANDGTDELRCLGFATIRTAEQPPRGLTGVTVLTSSRLEITADSNCTIGMWRCLRPIDFENDPPTWNQHHPLAGLNWQVPGASGGQDAVSVDQVALVADQPGYITGGGLAGTLQSMIDGGEPNFLLRRMDTSWQTVSFEARLVIEFELDSPPN